MNLDHLKSFLAVVETGSFSEVAKRMNISQPAVSFQIQRLEQELGVRLIDRRQKKLSLTEAGKQLMEFSEIVNGEYDKLIRAISQLREEVVGNLVITASTIPGDYILPPILSEFKKLHPAVKVQVVVSDSGNVIDGVGSGAYDVGFCGIAPEERDIETVKMAEDEIVLITFAGHPFAERKSIPYSEIAEEPMITREESSGTQRSVAAMLEKAGYDPIPGQPSLILGTTEAVVSAVEAGSGIAFVSSYAIKKSVSLGLVKVVDIQGLTMKRDFYCIYRKQRVVSRLLEEFISFISEKGG